MAIRSTRTIHKPIDQVWKAFTDPKTWRYWNGESLLVVEPGWSVGASLLWKSGLKATLVEVEARKNVVIRNPGGMVCTWAFEAGEGSTQVTLEYEFAKAEHALSNSEQAVAQCATLLEGFAHFVELS